MPSSLSFFLLLFVIQYYSFELCATSPYDRPPRTVPFCGRHGPYGYVCRVSFNSTISYGESAQELISDGGTFQLGFFQRGHNTYLGIWYGVEPTGRFRQDEAVIVWVANRDSPMPKQSYELRIAKDGEAKVFDAKNHTYWSTTSSTRATNASSVFLQLSDDGNLQLVDRGRRGQTLWESFQNPTDTFLPGMDIGILMVGLTSWRNPQDPALGEYHFIKENTSNVLSMYNISSHSPTLYWDVPFTDLDPILTSLLYDNITVGSTLMRLVMNLSRSIQLWEYQMGWSIIWTAPTDQCDLSETCGSFGVCDAGNSFKCKCLPGFKPNDASKWESGDFSSGCSKRTYDQCGQTFLSLPMAKLPPNSDIPTTLNNESDCKELCLRACGSKAYSFDASQSLCRIWTNDLTRIQEEYTGSDAQTLHIRVNNSDIDSGPRSCNICGTNVIPYPLSTNQSCGDQDYVKFECNTSNGQVYFKPPSGKVYRVTLINPNSRTFSVRLPTTNTSKACIPANVKNKVFNLKDSSPFSVMNCSVVLLWDKQVVDVELSWKPPPPPACNSSVDCTQWAETTCVEDTDGKNVCTCAKGFHWDSLSLKCNEVNPKHTHMPLKLTAGIATACGIVLLLLGGFLVVVHLRRKRARQGAGLIDQFKTGDLEEIDIPFVDYQTILVVTENFSDANKLGAGGFGPVYKGKMADGSEVAVKRLSTTSVQGIEEFRNEVILIAKLQHRNLVRVVGYCMKEDEKILIYEYMLNKSLSSFIFDQTMSPLLDWTKRFNIILGIARGLVYLHQDSRLRIIHRDLKPSNILLDEELNPKISDFGLARIVAGNEMATTTARVVGTYGYMSPEYALDGYFSIKSDVYSFGIIVLEVISGRKCTSLFEVESSLISLLGYAWTLWNKGRALELVDKSIMDSCDSFQVERCINVGLLCLQEDPSARPTMSSILLMLGGGNTMSVPSPNQPVFVARRAPLGAASSSSGTSKFGTSKSHVEYTTSVEGR